MNFNEIFDKTGEELKLKFLDAIIRHNEDLQQEFINFTTKQEDTSENRISPESFLQHITETQEEYVNSFERVDLENPDWDQYNPSHSGYIEEWEQYQQASEQEFEEIFDSFSSEALDLLIQQRIDDFTAMLIGLYEACLNAEIEDSVGSFYDVNEHLTGEHEQINECASVAHEFGCEEVVLWEFIGAVRNSTLDAVKEIADKYGNS